MDDLFEAFLWECCLMRPMNAFVVVVFDFVGFAWQVFCLMGRKRDYWKELAESLYIGVGFRIFLNVRN